MVLGRARFELCKTNYASNVNIANQFTTHLDGDLIDNLRSILGGYHITRTIISNPVKIPTATGECPYMERSN